MKKILAGIIVGSILWAQLSTQRSNGSLLFVDGGVAHGVTSFAATSTYGQLTEDSTGDGGFLVRGFVDTVGGTGLLLQGVIGNADPTDTAPALWLSGAKKSGTSLANLGDAETVLQLANRNTTLVTLFGNGDLSVASTGTVKGIIRPTNSAGSPATCASTLYGAEYYNTTDKRLCVCVADGTDDAWVKSDDYLHVTGHCTP